MHDNWLDPLPESIEACEDTVPIIRIPSEATCRKLKLGVNLEIHQRTGRCGYCKDIGYEKWFPGQPDSDCRVRNVPVPDEDTARTLYWWFSRYSSTPISVNSLKNRLSKLAERAGLGRNITPRDMRATYGTNLVRMEFSSREVAELMGLSTHLLTREFFEAAGRPVDWPENKSDSTILAAIAENEPVIKTEIGGLVGIHKSAGTKRASDLIDRGLVVKVGERQGKVERLTTYGVNPEMLEEEGFDELVDRCSSDGEKSYE
nr:tyrosine-type recombinase/integrase [Halobellus rarus]